MDIITKVFWEHAIIGLAQVNKDGEFIKANPAFCNLLGYTESELQHKKWQDITHPEDVEGARPMFEQSVAGIINSYTMEKRYLTKRGNIIWVSLFVSVLQDENKQFKLLLKQVISAPIIIEGKKEDAPVPSVKNSLKDNYRIIAGFVVGGAMTIVGAVMGHPELFNLGSALLVGIIGGATAIKK